MINWLIKKKKTELPAAAVALKRSKANLEVRMKQAAQTLYQHLITCINDAIADGKTRYHDDIDNLFYKTNLVFSSNEQNIIFDKVKVMFEKKGYKVCTHSDESHFGVSKHVVLIKISWEEESDE